MPINLTIKIGVARKLMEAISNASVTDKDMSELYYQIEAALDKAGPSKPGALSQKEMNRLAHEPQIGRRVLDRYSLKFPKGALLYHFNIAASFAKRGEVSLVRGDEYRDLKNNPRPFVKITEDFAEAQTATVEIDIAAWLRAEAKTLSTNKPNQDQSHNELITKIMVAAAQEWEANNKELAIRYLVKISS